MSPDRLLDLVGRPGGPLTDAALWNLEVIQAGPLTPNMHRLVFSVTGPGEFHHTAGQDLMVRVPFADDRVVNRRYTIRTFDPLARAVTMDASTHATGPGTDWIRSAKIGSRIDAIGPRGKVTLHDDADWHIFIADETGLPGALAMIESLRSGSTATALFEIDSADDVLPINRENVAGLEIRWLYRLGRSEPGDASLLLEAVATTDIPSGRGHVYVSTEARVARAVQVALGERGVGPDQISAKAYWRRGLPNAEHGEPTRED
jgi:NADPH-dependent ferric siderophore reductase